MCGIGGILRTDGQPIPEEWLDAIDARIAYRGPDGHGRFRDRVEIADPTAPGGKRVVEVAFVHRRLSIIDHKDGHQPMVSERGRNESEGLVAVVFNGCIYNHRELRKELEGKGHRFVTDHSDTEVLIHGWREWGCEILGKLEGMFAFALWDQLPAKFAIGRDWSGEKPLYHVSENLLSEGTDSIHIFASDPAAVDDICERSSLSAKAFPQRESSFVHDYLLWGFSAAGVGAKGRETTKTSLQNSCCSWSLASNAREGRSLQLQYPWYVIPSYIRLRDWHGDTNDEIETILHRAVARRLEADVPVGCFLSGGVDSSLIAHLASRNLPQISTFSVRMPDPRYDESTHAATVARHLGTAHTTLDASAKPAEDLIHLIQTLGQPFGDSSLLPTYWVSKAARQFVKVALSGDGGDEMFLGYERYMAASALRRFRLILQLLPSSILLHAHPKSVLHKLGRLGNAARDFRHCGVRALELLFRPAEVKELTHRGLNTERLLGTLDNHAALELRTFDVAEYLGLDLLRKVDLASMACGLEVRAPFLDRDLAVFTLNASFKELAPGGQRKGLLRQIARKYLPKEIVDRPKMGFAIPIGEWFRSDYGQMKTLLLDHLNSTEPFGPIQLNGKAVQRFIDEHMSGKRDHGQRLFTLLTLSIWARQQKNQQVNKSTSQK